MLLQIWCKSYHKVEQVIYYNVGQSPLQRRGNFTTKWGRYYKVKQYDNLGQYIDQRYIKNWVKKYIALPHPSHLPTWHEDGWRHMFTTRDNAVWE